MFDKNNIVILKICLETNNNKLLIGLLIEYHSIIIIKVIQFFIEILQNSYKQG